MQKLGLSQCDSTSSLCFDLDNRSSVASTNYMSIHSQPLRKFLSSLVITSCAVSWAVWWRREKKTAKPIHILLIVPFLVVMWGFYYDAAFDQTLLLVVLSTTFLAPGILRHRRTRQLLRREIKNESSMMTPTCVYGGLQHHDTNWGGRLSEFINVDEVYYDSEMDTQHNTPLSTETEHPFCTSDQTWDIQKLQAHLTDNRMRRLERLLDAARKSHERLHRQHWEAHLRVKQEHRKEINELKKGLQQSQSDVARLCTSLDSVINVLRYIQQRNGSLSYSEGRDDENNDARRQDNPSDRNNNNSSSSIVATTALDFCSKLWECAPCFIMWDDENSLFPVYGKGAAAQMEELHRQLHTIVEEEDSCSI